MTSVLSVTGLAVAAIGWLVIDGLQPGTRHGVARRFISLMTSTALVIVGFIPGLMILANFLPAQ